MAVNAHKLAAGDRVIHRKPGHPGRTIEVHHIDRTGHPAGGLVVHCRHRQSTLGVTFDQYGATAAQIFWPEARCPWCDSPARYLRRSVTANQQSAPFICPDLFHEEPTLSAEHVTPEIAAHVLHWFNGSGYPAGSFITALIDAMCKADPSNVAKLGQAYPGYARAVTLAKMDPEGMDKLAAILAAR